METRPPDTGVHRVTQRATHPGHGNTHAPTGANRNTHTPTGANRNTHAPTGANRNTHAPTGANRNTHAPTGANRNTHTPAGANRNTDTPTGADRNAHTPTGADRNTGSRAESLGSARGSDGPPGSGGDRAYTYACTRAHAHTKGFTCAERDGRERSYRGW